MERRTERQLELEKEHGYGPMHAPGCSYPSDPCNCEVENMSQRRTAHTQGCGYPSDPCNCGM